MLELLLAGVCWKAFKATPDTKQKRRRYNLATSFATK